MAAGKSKITYVAHILALQFNGTLIPVPNLVVKASFATEDWNELESKENPSSLCGR